MAMQHSAEVQQQFEAWLQQQTELVQQQARQFPPWKIYRIRAGAPYATTGPGTEVWIHSYYDDGYLGVSVSKLIVHAAHVVDDKHWRRHDGVVFPIPLIDEHHTLRVRVLPEWLEPLDV